MKKYLILIITIALLSSCKKWLDVKPQTEVEQEVLFSTEAGFMEAINGMYTRCAQQDLYGKELSVGFPDVLAQNYNVSPNDPNKYRQTILYNYKDQDFITRKDAAWKGLYNVIANSNIILEHVDKQKGVLSQPIYSIVKGEALAMRAYCHFDVLRLFAASYTVEPNGKGIPYVTAFSKNVPRMYKTGEAIDAMLQDLNAAKELLRSADPILTPGYKVGYDRAVDSSTEKDGPLFTQERRHHLNYYAVCGELARIYLYKGDHPNALLNALEVINAHKFPWTKQSDFLHPDEEKKDRMLYKELLFAVYVSNAETTDALRRLLRNEQSSLYIMLQDGRNIYETGSVGGEDFRYKQWFSEQSVSSGNYLRLEKYTRDPDRNIHPQLGPAIRLSEMYYIAAECTFDSNPAKAWEYFNTVRLNRGIGTQRNDPSKAVFMQELVKEARKELFGEGQIFYMYKRLNISFPGPFGSTIPATSSIFVLPFPDDEIAYSNR